MTEAELALQRQQEESAAREARTEADVERDNYVSIQNATSVANEQRGGQPATGDVFDPAESKGSGGTIPDLKTLEAMNAVRQQQQEADTKKRADKLVAMSKAQLGEASKFMDDRTAERMSNVTKTSDGKTIEERVKMRMTLNSTNPIHNYSPADISNAFQGPENSWNKPTRDAIRKWQKSVDSATILVQEEMANEKKMEGLSLSNDSKRADLLLKYQSLENNADEIKYKNEIRERTKVRTEIARVKTAEAELTSDSVDGNDAVRIVFNQGVGLSEKGTIEKFGYLRDSDDPRAKSLWVAVKNRSALNYNKNRLLGETIRTGVKHDASLFAANSGTAKKIADIRKESTELGLTPEQSKAKIIKDLKIPKDQIPAASLYIDGIGGEGESDSQILEDSNKLFSASDKSYVKKKGEILSRLEQGIRDPQQLMLDVTRGRSDESKEFAFVNKSQEMIKNSVIMAMKEDLSENQMKTLDAQLSNKNSEESIAVNNAVQALLPHKDVVSKTGSPEQKAREIASHTRLDKQYGEKTSEQNFVAVPKSEIVLLLPEPNRIIEVDGKSMTIENFFQGLARSAIDNDDLASLKKIMGNNGNTYGTAFFDDGGAQKYNDALEVPNFVKIDVRITEAIGTTAGASAQNKYLNGSKVDRELADKIKEPDRDRLLKRISIENHNSLVQSSSVNDDGSAFGEAFNTKAKASKPMSQFNDGPDKVLKSISDKYDDKKDKAKNVKSRKEAGLSDEISIRDMEDSLINNEDFRKKIKESSGGDSILEIIDINEKSRLRDQEIYEVWNTKTKTGMQLGYVWAGRKAISNNNKTIDAQMKAVVSLNQGILPNGTNIGEALYDTGFKSTNILDAYNEIDISTPEGEEMAQELVTITSMVNDAYQSMMYKSKVDDKDDIKGIHALAEAQADLGTGVTVDADPRKNADRLQEFANVVKSINEIRSLEGLQRTITRSSSSSEYSTTADTVASAQTAFFSGQPPPRREAGVSELESLQKKKLNKVERIKFNQLHAKAKRLQERGDFDDDTDLIDEIVTGLNEIDPNIDVANFIERSVESEPFVDLK